MDDSVKPGTSSGEPSVVSHSSTGEAKQSMMKDDNRNANKGTAYTAKDLERVTRTCVMIENAVGIKKIRLDTIGSETKTLIYKKSVFDDKIEAAEKEYRDLDSKGIDLSSVDFRQKCFLMCKIAEMINERCSIKKQLADYNLETSRINKEIYECENMYKTNIYLKEKIMKFLKK